MVIWMEKKTFSGNNDVRKNGPARKADGMKDQYRINERIRVREVRLVGEKEEENNEVSVRKQGEGDIGSMKIATFADILTEEVEKMITQW